MHLITIKSFSRQDVLANRQGERICKREIRGMKAYSSRRYQTHSPLWISRSASADDD